ncbi:MAG TPA: cupredoxin family copper-binding protein [Gemmatimonadales bacterium]|nr:cupredoxin family copper-binding protein [Gemmatimonadales bacterium]
MKSAASQRTRMLVVAFALAGASAPAAQSALDAPPNLAGAWVATPGVIQFNLIHRFDISPPPVRKLNNTPTLLVALGVTPWGSAGFVYGSNSALVPAFPNEWEFFGRVAPLREAAGAPLDAALQGGYNVAARSADFGITVARRIGRLRLLGTGAVLESAFDSGSTRWLTGGGATYRLTPFLALAGDIAGLTDRQAGEDLAWSAGVQLGVPYSPHSLSLHVTNVGTRTLQGLARGSGVRRVGFEYTIPITLGRYARGARGHGRSGTIERVTPDSSRVVRIDIQQIAFAQPRIMVPAGTTVEWINRDPLAHTVTADSGGFDSGLIEPAATWRHVFNRPGTYTYYCTPHPFMKGVVVVQ